MRNIVNLIKCLTFILIFIFIEDFPKWHNQFCLLYIPRPFTHSQLQLVLWFHVIHVFSTACAEGVDICRNGKLTNFDCVHCVFHLQTMETFLLLMFLWHLRKCSLLAGMCTFCRYFQRTASSKNAAALLLPPKQTTAHPNRLNSTYN